MLTYNAHLHLHCSLVFFKNNFLTKLEMGLNWDSTCYFSCLVCMRKPACVYIHGQLLVLLCPHCEQHRRDYWS